MWRGRRSWWTILLSHVLMITRDDTIRRLSCFALAAGGHRDATFRGGASVARSHSGGEVPLPSSPPATILTSKAFFQNRTAIHFSCALVPQKGMPTPSPSSPHPTPLLLLGGYPRLIEPRGGTGHSMDCAAPRRPRPPPPPPPPGGRPARCGVPPSNYTELNLLGRPCGAGWVNKE